ncbi:putative reverse transcriptase domain-containing protein [Tanacetum coccineum]
MSSENASSAVTYTSISSDLNGPSWGIPLVNAGELPEMDPYEEVAQQGQAPPLSPAYVEDQPYADDASSTAESPGYITDSDLMDEDTDEDSMDYPDEPEEDPKEDPSEEHKPKDDDEDLEEDPNEENKPKDEDTKDKEPSKGSDETEPFEEDKTTITSPPPIHCRARISVRPQTPMVASTQALIDAFAVGSPLFPLPPTSPAYDLASLGHRAAMISESSAVAATRPPRGQYDFIDTIGVGHGLIRSPGHDAWTIARAADRAEDVGHVRALQASKHRMMTSIKEVNLRVSYQAQVHRRESVDFYTQLYEAQTDRMDIRLKIDVVRGQRTAYETKLHEVRQAYLSSEARNRALLARLETLETHMSRMEWQRQSVEDHAVRQMMRTQVLEAKDQIDTVENASSAALTWWNGHVRTLCYDAAYAMTWGTLKKKLTDKYCPKGEIKKLEIELRNLRVRGNDVAAYTQRFQELALMCTKFLADETEKVDKYISGLPDNIHGNVMSARPKTLDYAIELANDFVDKI